MKETPRQNSIISYAGISKNTLYALAKQALAQADFDVPERFASFLPLFPFELIQNMDYPGSKATQGGKIAPSGFSIDPAEYHWKLYGQLPELYEGDNYRRNFDYEGRYQGKSVFSVDKAWATHFPQYQPFMGEKLSIYLIGGGHQAVALPESLYPRGISLLAAMEQRMQVTERAQEFVRYATGRILAGEVYDSEAFAVDYLAYTEYTPVNILQSELGRILQDVSIARSLQQENPATGLFTENARRVEAIRQYVPYAYACDTFEAASITRHTARLCQPCFLGADFVSDLWIPYQDANAYIDKQTMTLDMARLCEGYQIAPGHDPETGGGRYPNAIRVVIVRDREISMMNSDVLNNPAYGGGMNPQGMIGRQIFIPDSRELLRQRKLMPEDMDMAVDNTTLSFEAYHKALALAALQETKGRLVDAMYRREAALSQMTEGSRAYEKAQSLLDNKVNSLERQIETESARWRYNQVSGYDADLSYLARKAMERENLQEEERLVSIAFEPDVQREQSIESGYAMRSSIVRMNYSQLYVEPPEAEADAGDQPTAFEASDEAVKAEATDATETAQPCATAADVPLEEAAAETETALETETVTETEAVTETETALVSDPAEVVAAADLADPSESEPEDPESPTAENTDPADPVPSEDSNETAPPVPHTPHTFDELLRRPQGGGSTVKPVLAELAQQNRKKPVAPSNKKGKMASLVKKRPKR